MREGQYSGLVLARAVTVWMACSERERIGSSF